VFLFGCHIAEEDPSWWEAQLLSCRLQVGFSNCWEAQQPQHRVGNMLQYLLRGKEFCESLLVPVQHFISQYDQLHDITGCHGYNTVSQCWVFVKTLATINAQEQTAC